MLAPSADNMQPWEFKRNNNTIEVHSVKKRFLPTDVFFMFSWIGIGASIQNIVIKAEEKGLKSTVKYNNLCTAETLAATIEFKPDNTILKTDLAKYIKLRNTNRNPFSTNPLSSDLIQKLSSNITKFAANIHWTTHPADFKQMALMDAKSSYIRLEHKPLHDELFNILLFSKKEIEEKRFGLTFHSLGVPSFAVSFARLMQYWSITQIISKLGIGKMVAKQLSNKFKKTGAICLITSPQCSPQGYMQTGRAMEQLWLSATANNLSVQPYGVLPHYLTMIEYEPNFFSPKYIHILEKHRQPFYSIFPDAINEYPAIVLRIGRSEKHSLRSDVRLRTEEVIVG